MLTERQLLILKAIIQNYTDIGQPIGSKRLQRQFPIHISSATIRNEMAILEHYGFIMKEHSSSGRIPSLSGYRYYVDNLLQPVELDKKVVSAIHRSLNDDFSKVDDIIAFSAKLLSQMTNYVAISLKPEASDIVIEGFHLVPLQHSHQIMILLVTNDGSVQSQNFNIPNHISRDKLETVIHLINDQIIGLSLDQVLSKIKQILSNISDYLQKSDDFIKTFGMVLDKALRDQVYVSGKSNLLNFVKSEDISKVKSLYSLIDHTMDFTDLIKETGNDVSVTIKDGNKDNSSLTYSLVSATYGDGNHGQGLIAILGPTNMPYSEIIGMIETFRNELSNRLTNYYHNFDE